MRMRFFILIIISALSLFMISFTSVSAQNIDIENMDNAELLALLQAIMEKLETDGSEAATGTDPVQKETPVPAADPDSDPVGFEIYENKKITVEPLPAYMFIRKPTEEKKEPAPERNKVRDILQVVFDNDYQGVQTMLGFTSADDLYNAWKDSDTNWDWYGDYVNDWLSRQ